MSDPNTITARYEPDQPPAGLSTTAKMRWGKLHPPADPAVSFAGKTVLVTGANTGLGFAAALKYSALGADKLILGVRTTAKGEAAKARILAVTGRAPGTIIVMAVDLCEFASVQAFVAALEREVADGLDVVLLNAGLAPPRYEKAAPGSRWEMAVQVNVLSTALMALLLVPLLRATAGRKPGTRPHLTFVSSIGHDMVKREWLDKHGGSALATVNDREGWDMSKSYCTVKLMGMAVMQAVTRATVADRGGMKGPEVIVNAVCPGMCKTDLGRNHGWVSKAMMIPFLAYVGRSAEEGARSLVSATALGPESHGLLWHNDVLYP